MAPLLLFSAGELTRLVNGVGNYWSDCPVGLVRIVIFVLLSVAATSLEDRGRARLVSFTRWVPLADVGKTIGLRLVCYVLIDGLFGAFGIGFEFETWLDVEKFLTCIDVVLL